MGAVGRSVIDQYESIIGVGLFFQGGNKLKRDRFSIERTKVKSHHF